MRVRIEKSFMLDKCDDFLAWEDSICRGIAERIGRQERGDIYEEDEEVRDST